MGRRQWWIGMWLAVVVAAAMVPTIGAEAVNVPHSVIVSDNPVNWTPNVVGNSDAKVWSIKQIGDRVYVGGQFTQVEAAGSTTPVTRTYLFAYDANTGAIDRRFRPTLDERVYSIAVAPGGKSLFIGGEFQHINGTFEPFIAKIDATTGDPVSAFHVRVYDSVRDLVVRNTTLYFGGEFEKVNGQPRLSLAAVATRTGDLHPNLDVPFDIPRKGPQPFVYKLDVTPDASKLVAIGNFTRVGGLDRTELAVIDLTTHPASVANWETDRWKAQCIQSEDFDTRDVDISPDGSYFVTVSIGFYFPGSLCDTAARWDLTAKGSGLQPTWVDYTGGDSLLSVAVTGVAVYVGGHQRWMNNPFDVGEPGDGAVDRQGIAALDPSNGLPYSWNPGRSRGHGVFVQYSSSEGLFLGSDTDLLGGEYHGRFGFFPVAGGEAIPPAVSGTLPGRLFKMSYDTGDLDGRSFDGSSFGDATQAAAGTDWSKARGAFMLSGKLYTGWSDGGFYVRSFDGTNVGPAKDLSTPYAKRTAFHTARVTGMYFRDGRLYYTMRHDSRLFYRYFTPESGIVGAEQFVASGATDGLSWRHVRGMTAASGKLYFALDRAGTAHDGNLYSMSLSGGVPQRGTKRLVSGPDAGDHLHWKSRGLFVYSP